MTDPGWRVTAHEEQIELEPTSVPPWLALLDRMQIAAGRHAETLGVGLPQLAAQGLTWVLTRNHVRFAAVPASGPVHLATWPSGRRGLLAIRDFLLRDRAGNEVLRATSAWLLMRLDTRRPVRLDPHLPDYRDLPAGVLADDFQPLPVVPADCPGRTFPVQPADIDINDHVNNIVYVEWALRDAPPDLVAGRCPLSLEVAFLGEARLGDVVCCRSHRPSAADGGGLWQRLENGSGRELTRLRSIWDGPRDRLAIVPR